MTQPAEHCGHQPDPAIGRATECVLRPGHSGSHADHTGMRWWMRQHAEPGRRPTASTITDTQLEQLYAELDALKSIGRGYCPHCGRGDCSPTAAQWYEQQQRAERAEVERDRYRATWINARRRVKWARRSADSELHFTRGMWSDAVRDLNRYRTAWLSARERATAHREGTLRHVADRDAWKGWAKDAEGAIERVRRECDRIEAAVTGNPTSTDLAGGYLACLRHIRAALDEHQEQPGPAEQPAEETPDRLTHVGWWCWRGNNHGHLTTQACKSDNVPLHAPTEWADDMRAVIQRIEDGDDEHQEQP